MKSMERNPHSSARERKIDPVERSESSQAARWRQAKETENSAQDLSTGDGGFGTGKVWKVPCSQQARTSLNPRSTSGGQGIEVLLSYRRICRGRAMQSSWWQENHPGKAITDRSTVTSWLGSKLSMSIITGFPFQLTTRSLTLIPVHLYWLTSGSQFCLGAISFIILNGN